MAAARSATEMLVAVAAKIASLRWRVAFVGGATTHLHVTDRAAAPSRATDDVDVIIEVTRDEYQTDLHAALRALGAREDTRDGAPMCRWLLDDVVVDVMPVEGDFLGFRNRWYERALATATEHILPSDDRIFVVEPVHFLATKIDAFQDRGDEDFVASRDMEDIVATRRSPRGRCRGCCRARSGS